MKACVIFLVGHANWGKSETLFYLANRSRHKALINIGDNRFFIRHMSNDDYPSNYFDLLKRIEIYFRPYMIAPLCPIISDNKIENLFNQLKDKGYELFFWIMKHQYRNDNSIKQEEIDFLKQFGKTSIYSNREEANIRASIFKDYILSQF